MANRRQTLGVLGSNTLNSRQSIGAGRVAKDGDAGPRKSLGPGPLAGTGRPSLGGRPSLNGGRPSSAAAPGAAPGRNSLQRRASIYGAGPTVRADPRPLSDKAFQNSCMQKLITYLATHGYDRVLSPKLLSNNKEFAHIVQFLFGKVDPGIRFAGKVEDEVPALFKRLRYPFNISKSALQARTLIHAPNLQFCDARRTDTLLRPSPALARTICTSCI